MNIHLNRLGRVPNRLFSGRRKSLFETHSARQRIERKVKDAVVGLEVTAVVEDMQRSQLAEQSKALHPESIQMQSSVYVVCEPRGNQARACHHRHHRPAIPHPPSNRCGPQESGVVELSVGIV